MSRRPRFGIVLKFLLIFVTVFLAPTTVGFWQLVHYDAGAEMGKLTARIGNQAARAALALERHGALRTPELARDLLAPLAADRAVECVGLEGAGGEAHGAGLATGLECSHGEGSPHEVALPVGDGQTTLVVQFSDAEVVSEARFARKVMIGGLLLASLVAVIAASIGFRAVVGRRLSSLNAALRQIAENGERRQVLPGSLDELGQIMGAFNQMIASEEKRERELRDTEAALRRANDKLASLTRESEERFRDFVESASDWYWEMDERLRFSHFSDRFTEVTGVPKDALLGKTRRETGIPNVDPSAWQQHLDALDNHRSFRNFEHPRVKSSGETVWLSINGTPVFDDDGVFKGYRGTGSDITQRVRAKELVREKELSEQVARTKSEFLANMSHEIRTPINGVLGMTEILLKTDLDATQRRFANTIHRSGEALLRVINDILDFSKMEAGKLSLQSAPFHLRELMDEVGELFAESAHSKGLELVCHTPADLRCGYRGDAGRLRQILTNLVGNAIKFTESGEVVCRVETLAADGGQAILRFEVRDTGIGIDAEAQAHIFDSFAQVDGSTERRYGGTGLGLTISAQLARLMGGDIGLESARGTGSTFWFTVSLEIDEQASSQPIDARALEGARALIVDDNATNREILEHQLRAWGMRCDCADDGARALEMLVQASESGSPYEVAVLDMHMPAMDGLTLARQIGEDARVADVRRVMLSSVCDTFDPRKSPSPDIELFLLKPVRQAELHRCLDSLLGSSSNSAAPISDPKADELSLRVRARILVVEDNLVNQEVVRTWLEPTGAEIGIADNGQAAVDAWASGGYDLIFMDCQMPGMNGFEATGVIRNREHDAGRTRIPIVALTANALQGDRERCLDAGMDDYLSKPFTERQLIEVLQRWLPDKTELAAVPVEGVGARLRPSEVLDRSILDAFRERERRGRSNVLTRIVDAYVTQSAEHVEQLRQAVSAHDANSARDAAHTLKSSSAQVGATALSEICASIEQAARDRQMDTVIELIPGLEFLYPRVCAALGEETRKAIA